MSNYKADSNIDFKGLLSEPNSNIDFGSDDIAPEPYKPSANFDFTGEWLKPDANFDFGESETTAIAVYPVGITEPLPGFPTVTANSVFIEARGIYPPNISFPVIFNNAQTLSSIGFDSSTFGYTVAYNYISYLKPPSLLALAYGLVCLRGGVRYLSPYIGDSSRYGATLVVNTTATQEVKTVGINTPYVPIPSVSPRILYPSGINSAVFGSVSMQRSPMPLGLDQSFYGTATVWYHTRPLGLTGILSFESGYPIVFDPSQTIYTPSLIEVGIFGDIKLFNKTLPISVDGIAEPAISEYANVESNKRAVLPLSIDSWRAGDTSVRNKTPSIFPSGIANNALASPSVGYRLRQIYAAGFDSLLSGYHRLIKTPEILPFGNEQSAIGKQTVWYKNRVIETKGFDANQLGSPTTWFRYRYLSPESWASQVILNPILTRGVREVISKGVVSEAFGYSLRVSNSNQFVSVDAIYKEFPSNHFVGRHQYISAHGFDSSLFGTRIIPESQSLYPLSFMAATGTPIVSLFIRQLQPVGFISVGQQNYERWGAAATYNLSQYITQDFDVNSGLVPPKIDGWTAIANRNKTVGTVGGLMQRMGYTQIINGARQILPNGVPAQSGNANPMIAPAIRSVSPEGYDSSLISYWSVTYNAARVLSAIGFDSQSVGSDTSIITNRRYYGFVGRIESMVFGSPVVDYAIRTLDIETRYSIHPPQINLPTVDLHTRYIDCAGFDKSGMGAVGLFIRFNIINTRWSHIEQSGYPSLRNVTPELDTYGHNSNEFGVGTIRTQWRKSETYGADMAQYGKPTIADTKRTMSVNGIYSQILSDKLRVIKTSAPAYSTQVIMLDSFFDYDASKEREGQGIQPPQITALHRFHSNNLMPEAIVNKFVFGVPVVTANSIIVKAGYHELLFGERVRVYNSAQYVSLSTAGGGDAYKNKINSEAVFGKPRMSPHTIYSVVEAPQQAIDNHQLVSRHVVDGFEYAGKIKGVGNPRVELSINEISNAGVWLSKSVVSSALTVYSTRRVIEVKGIQAPILGLPKIPFTDQYAVCEPYLGKNAFGQALIKSFYFGPQNIKTTSVNSFNTGSAGVTRKDRLLPINGFSATKMGASISNDKPYMWQGLRIGEHVPIVISVGDSAVFGASEVSLKIRGVSVDGFDAFASEYDSSNFKGRMTVKRVGDEPEIRRITTYGEAMTSMGNSNIRNLQQFIKPDGNSDQFRKGGYHA